MMSDIMIKQTSSFKAG